MAYLVRSCTDSENYFYLSEEDYPDLPDFFRLVETGECFKLEGIVTDTMPNTIYYCPPDYILNGDMCEGQEYTAPLVINTSLPVHSIDNPSYGLLPPSLYPAFNTNGTVVTPFAIEELTNPFWLAGPPNLMDQNAIWLASAGASIFTHVYSFLSTPTVHFLAYQADGPMKIFISINGGPLTTYLDTDIFAMGSEHGLPPPVVLSSKAHIIALPTDVGCFSLYIQSFPLASNTGYLSYILFENTLSELLLANDVSDLNIVAKSGDLTEATSLQEADFTTKVSCPLGYTYVSTSPNGCAACAKDVVIDALEDIEYIPVEYAEITDIICFKSCEDCLRVMYVFTDCRGNKEDIYTNDPTLGGFIGKIVRVPYFDNTCFTISEVPFDSTVKLYPYLEVSGIYEKCLDCYPKKFSEPLELINCDPEKVSKISCLFADEVYKQMITRRLNIATSTEKDYNHSVMKFETLLGDLQYEEDPELPEPLANLCCIETKETLCEPVPNCLPCQEVAPTEEEECDCFTNAGPNHVCRTFPLNITQEMLDEASGNTDTTLDNKVFFGYYPCEEHSVVTKIFKAPEEIEICILGYPIYGYYNNNAWNNLLCSPSGICKEKQTNCI